MAINELHKEMQFLPYLSSIYFFDAIDEGHGAIRRKRKGRCMLCVHVEKNAKARKKSGVYKCAFISIAYDVNLTMHMRIETSCIKDKV